MNGVKELFCFKEKKILVVDSYTSNVILNRIYLTSEGIDKKNVVVIENILAAVEKAEHEIFDVIIIGIDIPGILGIEASKEIKKYYADGVAPKIIAYTINPDIASSNKYKEIFDDVMVQPIKKTLFVHKIFDILTEQDNKTHRV